MRKVILLKLGEAALKGLNRRTFEDKLTSNMRRRLAKIGKFDIRLAQSTYFIAPSDGAEGDPDSLADDAAFALGRVFGIASLSVAAECQKDIDEIKATAAEFLAPKLESVNTFKVEARRSDKRFPLDSPHICDEVGGYLLDHFPNLSVDVHEPEATVYVEVRDYGAYIHCDKIRGAGGMPVGTAGRAMLLLSGGIDSPVAGYMLAKRGAAISAVHFESPPYTSERARMKVLRLAEIIEDYCGRVDVWCVPFTDVQLAIRDRCPEDLFTLIMRRSMMRVANAVARKVDAKACITGESLGQVASQTMDAICVTDAVADMPVFRPLIGMDKEEIIQIARKIGTMETSILPYEDCCTVFTPKHPRLRPNMAQVEKAERAAGLDELLTAAIENAKIRKLTDTGDNI